MEELGKTIEGLEAMYEFFGFRLPSRNCIFEAYQITLTDAMKSLKKQEPKMVQSIRTVAYRTLG